MIECKYKLKKKINSFHFYFILMNFCKKVVISPSVYRGERLYELNLIDNKVEVNQKITFAEGIFLIKSILFFDFNMNILVFEVEDDLMSRCFIYLR